MSEHTERDVAARRVTGAGPPEERAAADRERDAGVVPSVPVDPNVSQAAARTGATVANARRAGAPDGEVSAT